MNDSLAQQKLIDLKNIKEVKKGSDNVKQKKDPLNTYSFDDAYKASVKYFKETNWLQKSG